MPKALKNSRCLFRYILHTTYLHALKIQVLYLIFERILTGWQREQLIFRVTVFRNRVSHSFRKVSQQFRQSF